MTRAEPESSPAAAAEPGFRRRLLDGMAETVRKHGYREATVADVVREARTSRRTFYEHFSSKQDCFIELLAERNSDTIRQIYQAVDPAAAWDIQVRQAIEAWIAASQHDPTITLAWIRDIPALGDDARELHRTTGDAFVTLIRNLTATPQFQSAELHPPSRAMATILYGGYRELIASTVEAGGDIGEIVDVAVETAIALIGPR
ncbi:TetR/AcrR family transcriptional regulator [Nocardia macrotermitis]|uniref:HTH tetR-type domain-containing protein n=1 Tax=Nocardia macrotermitis TaxID=2585198 RepID=A0A7K0CUE8_9NOCA|nr:TetR/AcrR family transcriptional regulator [Nocardia macrotermitis]MQY17107.1 hypothetical protein [Nocardia macrotermitis]